MNNLSFRTKYFMVKKENWRLIYSPKQAAINTYLPFRDITLIEILREFIKKNYLEGNAAIMVMHNNKVHRFYINSDKLKKTIYIVKISMGKDSLSCQHLPVIIMKEDFKVFKMRASKHKELSNNPRITKRIIPIEKIGLRIVKKAKK